MTWTPQGSQSEDWRAWLLRDGYWLDVGKWIDTEQWRDAPQPMWAAQQAQAETWTPAT